MRCARLQLMILGCWILLVSSGNAVWAQGSRSDVRSQLDRTDTVLEHSADQLHEANCARGERLLASALDTQRKARGEFLANTRAGTQQSLALTRQARALAQDAIQSCQVEFQAHEAARTLLESTTELAIEVRGEVEDLGNLESKRLLDAGVDQLEKAEASYRAEEYRRAIQLGTASRSLIERARLEARDGGSASADLATTQAALERTDALLAEVRASLRGSGDKRVEKLFEQAEAHQRKAYEFFREGRMTLALRWTKAAETRATESSWSIGMQGPDRERVERVIQVVQEMISDLGSEIRAEGGEDADLLLEKSIEQLANARELLADGRMNAAARSAKIAGTLLRKAAEKAGMR